MAIGFREVARVLRDQILDGDYPPGTQLPSERELAKDFDCSRDTVRDALALLTNEGYVITRRGFLTMVRPKLPPILIELPPDARVTTRPMTAEEAEAIGCGRGVAMFEVRVPGADPQLYRGDQYVLTTTPAGGTSA